jgi:predicted ATP-dependent protease
MRDTASLKDVTIRTAAAELPGEPRTVDDRLSLQPPRVQRALQLGLTTREPGFHVFVVAPPELALDDDLLLVARQAAAKMPPPDDVVFVHDFGRPAEPRAVSLPHGLGVALAEAMAALMVDLADRLPALAAGDDRRTAQRELGKRIQDASRGILSELEVRAKELGFGVRATGSGMQTFPILHGKPLSQEQLTVLDEATRKNLEAAEDELSNAVDAAATRMRVLTEEADDADEKSMQEAAEREIAARLAQAAVPFADNREALGCLERAGIELYRTWRDLLEGPPDAAREARLRRFAVHVVRHHEGPGAPVIYEPSPTAARLFGRVERWVEGGVLVTDASRLRTGSFLAASGGFLVVRAVDLLSDEQAWELVKRALRLGAHDIPDAGGPSATSMHPGSVPARPRVLLLGHDGIYAGLVSEDPDFAHLFRIKVEVDSDLPRTPESIAGVDGWLMTLAKRRGFLPFDPGARARMLDCSTRVAADREHVSMIQGPLEETAAFACHEARAGARGEVTSADVDRAWQDRRDRTAAIALALRDQILRGEVFIETSGTRVGVVNGLAVLSLSDVHFGQPMRITAVVSLGNEGLIDVEREAHLGGSVHTKGVAILRGILSRLFGQERPLSLRAQITFEQSYGEVDGDSASSAELFAVMSALADVALDQRIAVTGSVNQLGQMQPIGGVCAKIEAFHDLCAARGLTGEEGVIIPKANERHLVLRDDVAEAIATGKFRLWAISDVAMGIEILTGLPAGERDADGRFPAASVYGRVERRLIELAERLRREGSQVEIEDTGDAAGEGDGADMRRR